MSNTRFIMLYTDRDGLNRYMYCDDSTYIENDTFNVTKFLNDHPDMHFNDVHVTKIFNENDDLLTKMQTEEDRFKDYCNFYGFNTHDYGMRIRHPVTKEILLFVGFLPKNHKYKALLRNELTKKMTKATFSFVEKNAI